MKITLAQFRKVPEVSGADMKPFEVAKKRVFVSGHRGMVGQALVRRLGSEDCTILVAARSELDLRRQDDVERWFEVQKPDVVLVAAAKVGGISANSSYPAEFLYDNLMIEANIIHASWRCRVQKLLFLGSTCIYPKLAPQPIPEEALLTGPLEPTNEWYAIAKIAGIKLCQAYKRQYGASFIAAQPTNLYGPGDNYNLDTSHVMPALIRKAHEAKISDATTMSVWGSGRPLREFLHANDLADAALFLLKSYDGESHINIGSGEEISIADLAALICGIVGFKGNLVFDNSKPDGTMRKLSDVSRLSAMGWRPHLRLEEGIRKVYADWQKTLA